MKKNEKPAAVISGMYSRIPKNIIAIPQPHNEADKNLTYPPFIPRIPSSIPDTSIPDAHTVSVIPRVLLSAKSRIMGSDNICMAPIKSVTPDVINTRRSIPLFPVTVPQPSLRSAMKDVVCSSFLASR